MGISISDDTLRIDGFSTKDMSIISYFNDMPDTDREQKLEMLLRLAILATNSVGQTISIEHVEKTFDRLRNDMTQNIDKILGPKGDFVLSLEEYLGEDGKMQDMLDLNKTDSPLSSLQAAMTTEVANIQKGIRTEVMQIMTAISQQKGYEEAAKKGTQKGEEFEDRCMNYLCDIAKHHSDTVEHTHDTIGHVTNSKKGDFVVNIAGTKKKFVLEMKELTNRPTLPSIKRYLDDSMENRGADYSIWVSRNQDALPKEVGWFNEYGGNKLVCALSKNADDGDENVWALETAYRWARLKIKHDTIAQTKFDPAIINDSIQKIHESLKEIHKITTKCKNIRDQVDDIDEILKREERKIKNEIDEILNTLNDVED